MSAKLVRLLVLLPVLVFGLERGSPCTTPNGEDALCTAISDCGVIRSAVITKDEKAIDFARKSQCGLDSQPLVCCGTLAKAIERIPCKTPNGESSFCLPVTACSVIYKALQTGSRDALDFARKSKCDGTKDMVCCGSDAFSVRSNLLPDRSVCGNQKGDNRVWGGEITDIWEFPWMALLRYKNADGSDAGFRCGGTLINNRYILTAAHCVALAKNLGVSLDSVRLGEWRISTEPDCESGLANPECADPVVDLSIEEKIVHSRYDSRGGKNDIALLRLERNVRFTDYVKPICLPARESPEPPARTEMSVVGWGATEEDSYSDHKLKVKLPIVSREVCNKKIRQRGGVDDNQICAGGVSGKDSCQGDSGGPLMATLSNKLNTLPKWYQEGVVSWGVGCGVVGYPAVYTRVARYMDWILSNLKPF